MEEDDGRGRARRPRHRMYVRASIFIGLAAVAQASAALPSGPANAGYYWASLAVLVACVLSLFLPWSRFPRWAILIPTIGYLVSVTLLLISGGSGPSVQSTAGGLSALVLLPVLGMALYYTGLYTAIVVGASMVSLAAAGVAVQSSDATNLRRLFLWAAVAAVVGMTVHHLRNSLEGKVRDSAELARLGRLMNGATQSLTSLRDPKEVVTQGTLAMFELAGSGFRGASYLRVSDGVVTQEALADGLGTVPTSYLLRDDPYVTAVVNNGEPLVTRVDRTSMGATLRAVTDEFAVSQVALIPVTVNDELHGVFQIDSLGTAFSEDMLARCSAMANVVELALGNALAHQELEMQANTDPLTGLSNRRGLSLYLSGDRRVREMGILVMDIDHLKLINDAHGHEVGDQILVAVARSAAGVLRGGDLLARTGGDEFLAVVADADEVIARRVADRMTEAVSRVRVQGVRTSVSIGFACCGKNGDIDRLREAADKAMYEAKHVARRQHARHVRASDDGATSPGLTETRPVNPGVTDRP
jgi:diguanylate cyclase (GGDEF)-like protein